MGTKLQNINRNRSCQKLVISLLHSLTRILPRILEKTSRTSTHFLYQNTKYRKSQKSCVIINQKIWTNVEIDSIFQFYHYCNRLRISQRIHTIKNLQYALHIWNYPHVSESKSEKPTTTTYCGQSIFRLSVSEKGLRALRFRPTSANVMQGCQNNCCQSGNPNHGPFLPDVCQKNNHFECQLASSAGELNVASRNTEHNLPNPFLKNYWITSCNYQKVSNQNFARMTEGT